MRKAILVAAAAGLLAGCSQVSSDAGKLADCIETDSRALVATVGLNVDAGPGCPYREDD